MRLSTAHQTWLYIGLFVAAILLTEGRPLLAQDEKPAQVEKFPARPREPRTASPGGSDEQIQFNRSGVFGGDGSFLFDYANKIVGVGPFTTAYTPYSSTPISVPTLQISAGTPFAFQPGLQPVFGFGDTEYTG